MSALRCMLLCCCAGNFWGFLEGWFSWSSGLFDTALYPFLIVAYANNFLVSFCGLAPLGWWELYLSRIGIGVAVMMCNMLNVQMQGTISLIFACATLLPFLIMTLIGLPTALTDYKPLFTSFFPIEEVSWGVMLSAVLWVGSGWDSPGTVAGDVKTPKVSVDDDACCNETALRIVVCRSFFHSFVLSAARFFSSRKLILVL